MRFSLRLATATAIGLALGAGSAAAEMVIGVAGPMTGQYAAFGNQFKLGAEQAVKDINAAGGILGEPIKIEIADDACDPKQAVAVANDMAAKGIAFVAGHFCSGSSIPASAVYEEEGIIQISPASTNPKFTDEGGDNVYRVCGRDDQQGGVAGALIAADYADKNVAIIHDKTAYGKGLADETKKAMNAAGKEETLYEAITAGEKDYAALVSKMKANNIEIVFLGGYHTEAGLIVKQMRDQGLEAVLMGGDALVTTEYWDITGDAGAGTLMTFSPDPRKNPDAAPVVQSFTDAGVNPEGYVLYTYAAIQTYKAAVEKAGSTDTAAVIAALDSTEFDTVLGKFTFDEKGDVSLPGYVVYEWAGGSYDYLEE
ncbi:MAG: branched-chain amino acid ABC transporter substrate-binding protein [Pseudomonadota bacterium]